MNQNEAECPAKTPATIEYAVHTRGHPWRWVWVCLLLLLLVCAVVAWVQKRQIRSWYREWQADREWNRAYRVLAKHAVPEGTLAFDSDAPGGINLDPEASGLGNARGGSLVFAHEMTAWEGQKAVVRLYFNHTTDFRHWPWHQQFVLSPMLPTRHTGSMTGISPVNFGALKAPSEPQPMRLRIFAGQPDPNRPDRAVIPYEINGERGEIELVFERAASGGTAYMSVTLYRMHGPLGPYQSE